MSARIQCTDARHIEIGLVNNMPDAALDATERQFRTLIESAAAECSPAVSVNLSLYALPGKFVGGLSGFMVEAMGYPRFFATTALIGIPVALLCLLVWRMSAPAPRVITSG